MPSLNAAGSALFITKDGPAVVAASTPITYTLRIQNSGAATPIGLADYDQLPANVLFFKYTHSNNPKWLATRCMFCKMV